MSLEAQTVCTEKRAKGNGFIAIGSSVSRHIGREWVDSHEDTHQSPRRHRRGELPTARLRYAIHFFFVLTLYIFLKIKKDDEQKWGKQEERKRNKQIIRERGEMEGPFMSRNLAVWTSVEDALKEQ